MHDGHSGLSVAIDVQVLKPKTGEGMHCEVWLLSLNVLTPVVLVCGDDYRSCRNADLRHAQDERGMDVEHGDAFNCQPGQGQCPL